MQNNIALGICSTPQSCHISTLGIWTVIQRLTDKCDFRDFRAGVAQPSKRHIVEVCNPPLDRCRQNTTLQYRPRNRHLLSASQQHTLLIWKVPKRPSDRSYRQRRRCSADRSEDICWLLHTEALFFAVTAISSNYQQLKNSLGVTQSHTKRIIQDVSRLMDTTAGGDFLGLCDQKSSYKHVSDFGRLRSYGHFLIPVHALVWIASYGTSWRVIYPTWWLIVYGKLQRATRAVHTERQPVLRPAVPFSKTSFKNRSIQIKGNFTKLTLHLYFKCIMYYAGLLFCSFYCQ